MHRDSVRDDIVLILPFRVGSVALAVEAVSVSGVTLWAEGAPAPCSLGGPVIEADIAEILDLWSSSRGREVLILNAGDSAAAREQRRVLFRVDEIEGMEEEPLERVRALPPLVGRWLEANLFWGLVELESGFRFLLNPVALYRAALDRKMVRGG